jgi:YebC/PmpR family DNA-binding regulatory protein
LYDESIEIIGNKQPIEIKFYSKGEVHMSGHSKWHNIQKTKGAADAKRSAAFTKVAKEIIVAVKEGGGSGDPNNNSRLATVIAKAKAVNMPNENIKRTIDKALGAGNTDSFEAITYEGYGPGGVAVIVEALTDNRQRTAPDVRHAFDKCNGNMGNPGCVSWSFDRKGVIVIDNEDGDLDEDTVMMDALDVGAADFEVEGSALVVSTEPDSFNGVVKGLNDKGYSFTSAEIEMVPQNSITLSGEGDVKNMEKLIDMLEDNDDIQSVWHNWNQA